MGDVNKLYVLLALLPENATRVIHTALEREMLHQPCLAVVFFLCRVIYFTNTVPGRLSNDGCSHQLLAYIL